MPEKKSKVKFEYDMTYSENKDSIILNFSVITAIPIKVNGMKVRNQTHEVKPISMTRLYTDLYKHKYTVRVQTSFRLSELRHILTSSEPYRFEVIIDNENLLVFEDRTSVWRKENKRITEVFNLTTINEE